MKKSIVVLCLSLAASFVAVAQETHFGLKAGVNISNIRVKEADNLTSIAGLHIGGLAHIHLTEHFALQPELTYSMQGGKSDATTQRLGYINLPVLAQYMVNDGFRIETGPQVGFLTSSKSKTGNLSVDTKDQVSDVDFSWAFGVGYLFPTAGGLGIDARYNLGISNLSEVGYTAKNSVIQLGLFYQFMHAKRGHHK